MSLFGKIMAFIALIWSIMLVFDMLGAPDIYLFLNGGKLIIYLLGYGIIVGITIILKKVVAAM